MCDVNGLVLHLVDLSMITGANSPEAVSNAAPEAVSNAAQQLPTSMSSEAVIGPRLLTVSLPAMGPLNS